MIIVPVLNDARFLPTLLKKLAKSEAIFVERGSEDGSLALLEKHKVKILKAPGASQAEALNLGAAASCEDLIFLSPRAEPQAGWEKAFAKAAGDFLVGEILTVADASPFGRLSAKIFKGHSQRAAFARGHALPWGPWQNLAVKRELFDKVGPFSTKAGSAFDIDWCWRAMLLGARPAFAPKAAVKLHRLSGREENLYYFDEYGQGEAWLRKTYSFLTGEEESRALEASVEGFERLRRHSQAAKVASLIGPLEEVAVAFASGLRAGLERAPAKCPLPRKLPDFALSWRSSEKEETVFVPGKGVTELEGKPLRLWEAQRGGASQEELLKLFRRLFRVSAEEAEHGLADFLGSLKPGGFVFHPV